MSIQTIAPATSPIASDPFYALGVADAYDEHMAGEPIDTLKRRAAELLETEYPTSQDVQPSELYVLGYVASIAGIVRSHIATVNAQIELAYPDSTPSGDPA